MSHKNRSDSCQAQLPIGMMADKNNDQQAQRQKKTERRGGGHGGTVADWHND